MSLATGPRLGPYEVVGLIGAGGMGEVYRAHFERDPGTHSMAPGASIPSVANQFKKRRQSLRERPGCLCRV